MTYFETFYNGYIGYANYLWRDITNPSWHSYFYWLWIVSIVFMLLEWWKPWRVNQARFRKDFFLDFFYMFFNFFLVSLIAYNAVSDVGVRLMNETIMAVSGFNLQAQNPMRDLPMWAILLIGFIVRDFIQWWIHRLLHWSPRLWEFHKLHHSVEEMGFAAHLRYHWAEGIVYRIIEYIPLALLGIGLHDFFVMHIFALTVGHYNHSNISVPSSVTGGILGALLGVVFATQSLDVYVFPAMPLVGQIGVVLAFALLGALVFRPAMKILFNSPEMHIWHHSYDLPADKPYGVNFGLTLGIWDYIFGTAHIPHSGRDIRLGFPHIEQYPKHFSEQITSGFVRK